MAYEPELDIEISVVIRCKRPTVPGLGEVAGAIKLDKHALPEATYRITQIDAKYKLCSSLEVKEAQSGE